MKTLRPIILVLILFMIGCSGSGSAPSPSSVQIVPAALSSDTTLTSTIGEVRGNSLVNIPFGTTVDSLRAAITVAAEARFDICEADGRTVAANLTGSSIIVVTAEDDTKATYTLAILKDPAIVAEWIGFTSEIREYVIADAQKVDGHNGNVNALLFDGDPATLDYVIAPDRDALTLQKPRNRRGPGPGGWHSPLCRNHPQGRAQGFQRRSMGTAVVVSRRVPCPAPADDHRR